VGLRSGLTLRRIISGGQTGADWASLDWAIAQHVPHGGWCPLGRRAENGLIDSRFLLQEAPSPNYAVRTKWNVRDSDGTIIFTLGAELSGGSLLTWNFAGELGKPRLHLSAAIDEPHAAILTQFLSTHAVQDLNIAGPRESTEPGVGRFVTRILDEALLAEHGTELDTQEEEPIGS
jgi:hypothetical protein